MPFKKLGNSVFSSNNRGFRNKAPLLSVMSMFLYTAGLNSLAAAEVNIYSARQPFLIAPILNDFTERTGIVINIVYTSSNLVDRLKLEGDRSAVDLILTSDVAPLYQLASLDLTQQVDSAVLQQNIPAPFRDPQNHWYGLTSRARIIYASKTRVADHEIENYEQLMDEKWHGRICSRSAKHNYMLSLIGSMILAKGEQFTEQWLLAVKGNLARKPQGNDRAQVKAISEGVCDLALVNSYYFGKMMTNKRKPEQIVWAKSVKLIFPNQHNRGSHMNISGIALSKNAPNKAHAIQLMEYLSGDNAQYTYAQDNHEFPVRKGTLHSELLQQYMPKFKQDNVSLAAIAEQRGRVLALIKRVDFDH
ncbi:MAG: extracellular solute-binding protein [Oceanospirillaceae bacterium]|nr:extracellular solute-binding protein [Oceanospirillaceae bacterium]